MRNTNIFIVDGNIGYIDTDNGYFVLYSNADYYDREKEEYVDVVNSFSVSMRGRFADRLERLSVGDTVSLTLSVRSYYDKEKEEQKTYYNPVDVRMMKKGNSGESAPSTQQKPKSKPKKKLEFNDADW